MTKFIDFLDEALFKSTKFKFNVKGGAVEVHKHGPLRSDRKPSWDRHETARNNLHKFLSNHYTYNGNEKKEYPDGVEYPEHYENHSAIGNYTNGSSTSQNSKLHQKFDSKVTNFGTIKDTRSVKLDKILNLHSAPSDFHVYSGLKESPERLFHQQKVVGLRSVGSQSPKQDHIKAMVPSFMSTSLEPNLATEFAHHSSMSHPADTGNINSDRHMLKIHIPKGSNHGGYVGHISEHSHEYEFILRPGTKFHIDRHPEKIYDPRHNNFVHVWHAKVAGNHYKENVPPSPAEVHAASVKEHGPVIHDYEGQARDYDGINRKGQFHLHKSAEGGLSLIHHDSGEVIKHYHDWGTDEERHRLAHTHAMGSYSLKDMSPGAIAKSKEPDVQNWEPGHKSRFGTHVASYHGENVNTDTGPYGYEKNEKKSGLFHLYKTGDSSFSGNPIHKLVHAASGGTVDTYFDNHQAAHDFIIKSHTHGFYGANTKFTKLDHPPAITAKPEHVVKHGEHIATFTTKEPHHGLWNGPFTLHKNSYGDHKLVDKPSGDVTHEYSDYTGHDINSISKALGKEGFITANAPKSTTGWNSPNPPKSHSRWGEHIGSVHGTSSDSALTGDGKITGWHHVYKDHEQGKHNLINSNGNKVDGWWPDSNREALSHVKTGYLSTFKAHEPESEHNEMSPEHNEVEDLGVIHKTVKAQHLGQPIHHYHGTHYDMEGNKTHTGNFSLHSHLTQNKQYLKHESGDVLHYDFNGHDTVGNDKFITGKRDDLGLQLKHGKGPKNRDSFSTHSNAMRVSDPPQHVEDHEPDYGYAHLGYKGSSGSHYAVYSSLKDGFFGDQKFDPHKKNAYIHTLVNTATGLDHQKTDKLSLHDFHKSLIDPSKHSFTHTDTYSPGGKAALSAPVSSRPNFEHGKQFGPVHAEYHGIIHGKPTTVTMHQNDKDSVLVDQTNGHVISHSDNEWAEKDHHLHNHALKSWGLTHKDNHSLQGDKLTGTNKFLAKKVEF